MQPRRQVTGQNGEMAHHEHQARGDDGAHREILSILTECGFVPGQGIEGMLGRFYRGEES